MNITTSLVIGHSWIAYNLKIYHFNSRHFCMYNKESYELEYEEKHLVVKNPIDTAELILLIAKLKNMADLAIEQIEENLKDKIE